MPRVGNTNLDIVPRLNRPWSVQAARQNGLVPRLEFERAAIAHGIPGINGQIDQRLLQLDWVHRRMPKVICDHSLDIYFFFNRSVQQPAAIGDELVHIDLPQVSGFERARRPRGG